MEGDWRLGTGETGPVTRPSLATLHFRYLHHLYCSLHCRYLYYLYCYTVYIYIIYNGYLHYLYCSRPALTISIIHRGEVDIISIIYLSVQTCRAAAFTHKLTKLAILHRPTSLSLKPFLCTNNRHFKVKE